MELLSVENVSSEELDSVDKMVAEDLPAGSALSETLSRLTREVRAGSEVVVSGGADPDVTPTQAARILKVSRTHLYKLLDSGVLPSVHVGRDRRMTMADVFAYEVQRHDAKKSLAERFAHADRDRAALLNSMIEGDPTG